MKNEKNYGKSIVVFLVIFVFLSFVLWSVVTQLFAYNYNYFDKNYMLVNQYYPFYRIFVWFIDYPQYKDIFLKYILFGIIFQGFIFVVCLNYLLIFIRKPKNIEGLHGSAEFAKIKDIEEMGVLHKNDGVIIGGYNDESANILHYLRDDSPEHLLLFAPTRTGKGVGIIIPTLLTWAHSCLVFDIKGENWALTSGWRKKYANNRVLKFEPTANDGSSVRFNVLEEIRLGTDYEVGDVQNIAYMLADPEGKGMEGDSGFWQKMAYSLLTAVILHVCYMGKKSGKSGNLSDVARFLSGVDAETYRCELILMHDGNLEMIKQIEKIDNVEIPFYYMKACDHLGNGLGCHPLVEQEAQAMINKPEKERGGVISSATAGLNLYQDKVISKNIEVSDFKISDLMNDDKPVSLYIVVSMDNALRIRPLLRLMVDLIVRKLTSKMEFKDGKSVEHYKHRLLLLLDEFPTMGKMTTIEQGLAYIAGYGMKAFIIVQDLEQITGIYSENEGITGNCNIRIAYTPNKLKTAEYLSKLVGFTTVNNETLNVSGKRSSISYDNISKSITQVKRELMTPEEISTMKKLTVSKGKIISTGEMLIFIAGKKPIKGNQILYFTDKSLSKRAQIPAPKKSDVIRS